VVEHFSGDLLSGGRATWSEDGALMSTGEFQDGLGVGVHKEWSREGALVMKRTHDDPPGSDREERWWPSGQLRSRGLFVEGRRSGIWEAHHEDGSVDASLAGTWTAGERVSD